MRFRQRQASVHTPPASDFTDNSGGKVQQASKRVAEEALASPRRRKREGAVDLYAQQHRPTDALPPCHDDNQKHWQHHSKWPPKEQPAESPILRASYTPRASAAAAVMSRQRQQQQQMGRGNVVIYGSSYRGGRGWSCPSNSSTNPEAANNSYPVRSRWWKRDCFVAKERVVAWFVDRGSLAPPRDGRPRRSRPSYLALSTLFINRYCALATTARQSVVDAS
ncbi:hypothetical protein MRX96_039325 [Rhipicephalus microplus]